MKLAPLVILAMSNTLLIAQDPEGAHDKETPVSKVERKNRAPVSKDLPRITLPKVFEAKLENGLTVLILEDKRAPLVTAQLAIFGAGELYVPSGLTGQASFTADLLDQGTKSRSSQQIAEQLDRLGATLQLSAPNGGEATTISLTALSEVFEQALFITADILVNPVFPQEEFEKLRKREAAALQQQFTSPQFLLTAKFNDVLFGSHPAAIESATPATLEALTRDQLVKWHRERYAPQNSILTIAGDVDAKDLFNKVKRLNWVWTRQAFTPTLPDVPKPAAERKIYLVNRPGSVQTLLRAGNLAIHRTHEDFFPMVVLNRILGGGSAGRLFLNLREEKGYSYSVTSRLSATRFVGPWSASGSVRTEVTGPALGEFFREIRRIAEEPVPAGELEEAKRSLIASFALTLESPARLASYATERKRYDLAADYWEKYPERVTSVTAEDIQRVARKHLKLDAIQVVAVGDAAAIEKALAEYGPVERAVTNP